MMEFLREVSRSIKRINIRICKMRENCEKSSGREPDHERTFEIAMNMPMEELAMTGNRLRGGFFGTVYQEMERICSLWQTGFPEKEDRCSF
ncbi:MAG: hypothetical protein ACLU4P_02785 [Ruminococcus sp.]